MAKSLVVFHIVFVLRRLCFDTVFSNSFLRSLCQHDIYPETNLRQGENNLNVLDVVSPTVKIFSKHEINIVETAYVSYFFGTSFEIAKSRDVTRLT